MDSLEKYRKKERERKIGAPFTVRPTAKEDEFLRKHGLNPSMIWHGKLAELMEQAGQGKQKK